MSKNSSCDSFSCYSSSESDSVSDFESHNDFESAKASDSDFESNSDFNLDETTNFNHGSIPLPNREHVPAIAQSPKERTVPQPGPSAPTQTISPLGVSLSPFNPQQSPEISPNYSLNPSFDHSQCAFGEALRSSNLTITPASRESTNKNPLDSLTNALTPAQKRQRRRYYSTKMCTSVQEQVQRMGDSAAEQARIKADKGEKFEQARNALKEHLLLMQVEKRACCKRKNVPTI